MKKYILLCMVLLGLTVASCDSSEAPLSPSNSDKDRVESQLDLSNPTIKKLYADFNVGVLYEYDNVLDFAYVASSSTQAELWGGVEIPQIKTLFADPSVSVGMSYKQYVNTAIEFLNTSLFSYFDPNGEIATLMPPKVLISESVFSESLIVGNTGDVLTTSEERYKSTAQYGQRTIYNDHSIVFGLNLNEIDGDEDEYTKDNFYIFLSRIISTHKLGDRLPNSFFAGKDVYYNQEMEPIYREEQNLGEEKRVDVIDKNWFYSKGFIDAQYFYNGSSGLRSYNQYYDEDGNRLPTRIRHTKAIRPSYEFISGKDQDVRSYLNELMFRDADEISAFPQKIQDNLKALYDLLTGLGVDLIAINPELSVLN
ncbi:hypothetical protein [Tenacibaculum aestuarii]|uniref:hypothetical protein n=1 Tax=Tenacibaculum aestuarii TaxID=362781 RepID=UPI0038960356